MCPFPNDSNGVTVNIPAQGDGVVPVKSEKHEALHSESKFARSRWAQFHILTGRQLLCTMRNPAVVYLRTFTILGIAFLVGLIFWNQKDIEESITTRINTMMLLCCVFSLFVLPAIAMYAEERIVFTRERASGYYSTMPYYLASVIVELPMLFILISAYSGIAYWMVHLRPDLLCFLYFLLLVVAVVLFCFSGAQVLAAGSKSINVAIAVYVLCLLYSMLLGGFFIAKQRMPAGARWAVFTSPFWYTFEGLLINEFYGKNYASYVFDQFQLNGNKWLDLGIMFSGVILLRILSYLFLRFLHQEKK